MKTSQSRNISIFTFTKNTLSAILVTVCVFASSTAVAQDKQEAGILDQPLIPAGKAPSVQLSKQEAKALKKAQREAAKSEEKELKKLAHHELKNEAKTGDRMAQLVLAADFAEEAITWAALPDVANAALSDAAYWYSLAAKRGYPGSPAIDKVLPAIPMRVVRRP